MDKRRQVMLASGLAAAIATGAIVAGVAFATPSTPSPDPRQATTVESVKAPEVGEAAESDGIDHRFEGEEVGENGNGVPDANEATEADEAKESAEAAESDGIDHPFEGEEVGENGNGIPDASEATEAQ